MFYIHDREIYTTSIKNKRVQQKLRQNQQISILILAYITSNTHIHLVNFLNITP